VSHLTTILIGISPVFLIGAANLATATNSAPLYNPTVVIYGAKYDPVTSYEELRL
jgi:hypothetical protein